MTTWDRLESWSSRHLNFYRIHVLTFIAAPLIFSGIFYASNGETRISYVDSLFMVSSCATVTGLNSVVLSSLTVWQQVILFMMMCFGSTSTVSIVTIVIRRRFFSKKLQNVMSRRALLHGQHEANLYPTGREGDPAGDTEAKKPKKKKKKIPLTADMVKRVDVPVLVNQMNGNGWLSEVEQPRSDLKPGTITSTELTGSPDEISLSSAHPTDEENAEVAPIITLATTTKPVPLTSQTEPQRDVQFEAVESPAHDIRLRRRKTIDPDSPAAFRSSVPINRFASMQREYPDSSLDDAMNTGFGGLPNPIGMLASFVVRKLPGKLDQKLNMPRTTTFTSTANPHSTPADPNHVGGTAFRSYLTFDLVNVGANSRFGGLTAAQREELGGVEYRALTALLKIVTGYWLVTQLFGALVLSLYFAYEPSYRYLFDKPQSGSLSSTFFVFFQVWSAFSNNGMSLIDDSMLPFGNTYLLIIIMCFLILAGNTAYPIFLRLTIWIISKLVPAQSRIKETLQFLLDHPRRCFIYLFPAHQTWYLVFVLFVLNGIDWASFLILDIGTPSIEAIPLNVRVIDGLFQSFAVRAAGFSIVQLSLVSPALQFLYVVMMYIAVYPIAIAIRSTNVYEEQSMGIFEDETSNAAESEFENKTRSPLSYIAYHAKKQLAFDLFWIVLAIWLLCIIERGEIIDVNIPWITIFTITFETISAYGTVGLSLGNGVDATSLSGNLKPLSKLILIAVMIRGRHRGLPFSIDRAVLLPAALERFASAADRRRSSSVVGISSEDRARLVARGQAQQVT